MHSARHLGEEGLALRLTQQPLCVHSLLRVRGWCAAERLSFAATRRHEAFDAVFWDDHRGVWCDRWLRGSSGDLIPLQLPTDNDEWWLAQFAAPLWCGLADGDRVKQARVVASLLRSRLIGVSGALTSTVDTGQQWDAPNAWPPLQDMLIQGLQRCCGVALDPGAVHTLLPHTFLGSAGASSEETDRGGEPRTAGDLALRLAGIWVANCFLTWSRTGFMYVRIPGAGGCARERGRGELFVESPHVVVAGVLPGSRTAQV